MAVLNIENLLVKFGAGKSPKSGDYLDLIDTLADDRNAVYFSATAPEDTGANPLWFNTSTNVLSVYSNEAWSNIDLSLKAPLASPTFTGTVTIPSGSSISDIPYLATANTFTASQIIQPTSTSSVGLIVKGLASQTADMQQWRDSTGAILASISSVGTVRSGIFASTTTSLTYIATNFDTSGIGVVISSAAQKGLVVRGAASQTANLQEWQNSAGTTLFKIRADGTFNQTAGIESDIYGNLAVQGFQAYYQSTLRSGIPSLSAIIAKGSASQTANLQEWQDSAGTVLTKVRSLGQLNVGGAFSSNTFGVANLDPVWVAAIVKGAASQTANLQEWQNSSGTVLTGITSAGQLFTTQRMTVGLSGISSLGELVVSTTTAARIGVVVQGVASQTANLQEWQDSAGTVLGAMSAGPSMPSGSGLFFSAGYTRSTYFYVGAAIVNSADNASYITFNPAGTNSSSIQVTSRAASHLPLSVRGAASQTANLQEWQNSAGTALATINSAGRFRANPLGTSTDYVVLSEENSGGYLRLTKQTAVAANSASGQAKLYFRDGTTAGTLKLVVIAGTAGTETTILDNIPQ